jgi:hypothetical protein
VFITKRAAVTHLCTVLAVVVLATGQSFAGEPNKTAPTSAVCCAPPEDDIAIEQQLNNLLTPALSISRDTNMRWLIRNIVARQFDGDTNALFSTIIQEAEESRIVDPNDPAWISLKYYVSQFQNINGWAYQPQIYIPDFDEGVQPQDDVVMAVAPADETLEATTGYRIDDIGLIYPLSTPIDEFYMQTYEVWILSVNEPLPSSEPPLTVAGTTGTSGTEPITNITTVVPEAAPKAGPHATPAKNAKPSNSSADAGTLAVCNPTGIRNNLGQEYLQRWRVPDKRSFGGGFDGKREMRLQVLTVSGTTGTVMRTFIFPKIKRKHLVNWQNSDMFITTWDRALYGDVFAYQWSEIDSGPPITVGITIPLPGGISVTANVQWQKRDDDGGNAPVLFPESTYNSYSTAAVEFNVCSMGGDGGTGNDNLACASIASASSTYPGYSPARVNDCNRDTRLGGAYSWANNAGTYPPNNPEWVQVDFGLNRTFRRVVVYTSQGYPIRDFDVQVWNGVTFITVGTVTGNTALSVTVTFPVRTSRLVRILGRSGPTHQPGYVRVNELEVYAV